MSLKKFLENLKKIPRKYRRMARNYMNNINNKGAYFTKCCKCPIAALGSHLLKTNFETYQYRSVATKLGISYNNMCSIVNSADYEGFTPEYDRLRKKMLDALGKD